MASALFARVFAERVECRFVDRVSHREVWLYRWRGSEWLADGRLGMWMARP